jgi:hypothetical protein
VKTCPTCHQTYIDGSLNFCLTDGSVLNSVNQDLSSQPTVFMGQSPVTNQSPTFSTNPLQNWGNGSTVSPLSPPKRSKAWLWIVGIIGGFVLLGGIVVVGAIALIATNSNTQTERDSTPPPEKQFSSKLTDDFSRTNWYKANDNNGNSEYRNGEFFVSSKQISHFYVLTTGDKDFKTWNATTTVTVRNVNGTPTNLGYGIVLHSNLTVALDKDYGFLIDSTKQSFRIVQHQKRDEKTLVNWTKLPAIRSGTQTNEIQVKDENGKMSMFVNGQFASTITDSVNFKDGVAGVYAADAVPIAFSNLQLGK